MVMVVVDYDRSHSFWEHQCGEKKEQASYICDTSTVRRRKRQIGILLQQQKTNICMVGWWVGGIQEASGMQFFLFGMGV